MPPCRQLYEQHKPQFIRKLKNLVSIPTFCVVRFGKRKRELLLVLTNSTGTSTQHRHHIIVDTFRVDECLRRLCPSKITIKIFSLNIIRIISICFHITIRFLQKKSSQVENQRDHGYCEMLLLLLLRSETRAGYIRRIYDRTETIGRLNRHSTTATTDDDCSGTKTTQ